MTRTQRTAKRAVPEFLNMFKQEAAKIWFRNKNHISFEISCGFFTGTIALFCADTLGHELGISTVLHLFDWLFRQDLETNKTSVYMHNAWGGTKRSACTGECTYKLISCMMLDPPWNAEHFKYMNRLWNTWTWAACMVILLDWMWLCVERQWPNAVFSRILQML